MTIREDNVEKECKAKRAKVTKRCYESPPLKKVLTKGFFKKPESCIESNAN